MEINVKQELFSMQDIKYRDFHSRLMPTVDPETIIGVRTPQLRKFAKAFSKTADAAEFLNSLPHEYYEENNLHMFIIEGIKDFDSALSETKRFLPYINNWATCDARLPKVFSKNKDKLLPEINEWIKSSHTYTVRYAIGVLMSLFLDDDFDKKYLELVAAVKSEEYYINMMIAWYFATALAKQRDAAMPYITEYRLPKWVHNKTIQKAVESYRIDDDLKTELKTYRIK